MGLLLQAMLQSSKCCCTDWPTPMGGELQGPKPPPPSGLGNSGCHNTAVQEHGAAETTVMMHKSIEDGDSVVAEETGG